MATVGEIAWLAGLIDGEGSFKIRRQAADRGRVGHDLAKQGGVPFGSSQRLREHELRLTVLSSPIDGTVAVTQRTVRQVLAVMSSCGMYDGAGRWIVSVGLPAKSGVSGGIIAVLPGQLGVAVFSPRLAPRATACGG